MKFLILTIPITSAKKVLKNNIKQIVYTNSRRKLIVPVVV